MLPAEGIQSDIFPANANLQGGRAKAAREGSWKHLGCKGTTGGRVIPAHSLTVSIAVCSSLPCSLAGGFVYMHSQECLATTLMMVL